MVFIEVIEVSQISMVVGENIRVLRQNRGLSQEKLALRASINTSYIGQVERGEKSPTIDTLEKIATALEVTVQDLFKPNEVGSIKVNFGFIEKVTYEMQRRPAWEQEEIYHFVRKLLWFRDKQE
ncbi:helix-turn-helix transcriptional regulator [Paenibacillus athensensis]|nr:helix-turn-helix transcriptional regulator [Paenibacillus athensensis]MCD1259744.1 helix-turn-helix transcriptional regulator [Paenibacillus athensensis]